MTKDGAARVITAGCVLVLLFSLPAIADPGRRGKRAVTGDEAALRQVLAGFDDAQTRIQSLSAEFVQTTSNPLLKQPLVSRGRFFLTKPDSVLLEYAEPEVMRFSFVKGVYVGYIPQEKRAEREDAHRRMEQIFRLVGIGQGSKELEKFYEISLGSATPDAKGDYLLILRPKKRRIRKQVEEVDLWVDAKSFLPVKIERIAKDGQSRFLWEFHDVRVNPDLSASLYKVELPSDVKVTRGFSMLGGTVLPEGSGPSGD